MAYYSYNYHQSYPAESYQTPYGGNYGIVPQALVADSSREFSSRNFFEYNPNLYSGAYDPPMNHSLVAYSAYSFTEPNSVVYDPYSGGCNSATTQIRISYSVSEVIDDLEFEEYDSTPYSGGYDLALTYGKPLSPSEEICYPRSLEDSSVIVLPQKENVEESAAKPNIETKPTPAIEEGKQQFHSSSGDVRKKEEDDTHDSSPKTPEKPSGLIEGEDSREVCSDEGNRYEYEKSVPQIPSGYGLEAMDLCESLFGYWPCLARYNKRNHDCQEVANEESSCNQWKDTADYLFGSSYPYSERRDGGIGYGDPMYSYERHYQEQPLYRQVEHDEDSWF